MKPLILIALALSGCAVDAANEEVPLTVSAPGKSDGGSKTELWFGTGYHGGTFSVKCDEWISCNVEVQFEVFRQVGTIPDISATVTRRSDGLAEDFTLQKRFAQVDEDETSELRVEDSRYYTGDDEIRPENGKILMYSPNSDEKFTLEIEGQADSGSHLTLFLVAEWR